MAVEFSLNASQLFLAFFGKAVFQVFPYHILAVAYDVIDQDKEKI